jgi:glycosyltransferase involved in cell wall biosynthesis
MRNPRVFIVIATFLPIIGGAEKQALAQGRSLHQRGFEATIVTFHHNRSWAAHDMIDGVPVIRVAGTLLGDREKLPRILQKLLYLVAMMVMGWSLWRYRHCYDVLHVYQLNLLALPTAISCYLSGKPMIIAVRCADSGKRAEFHNQILLTPGPLAEDMSMLRVSGDTRTEGDLKDLERLGKPVVRFTHFLLQRINAVVIILSSRMKGYLVSHDFAFSHMQLIPNGVDISHFTPVNTETFPTERGQIVICLARLCYQKGIDVLLQAWNLVHQELPQARLLIAGTGPIQTQLEYMAQAFGLMDSVEFVGLQNDIPNLLHQGDIAVLPSRWEGMPNALLEAMASGLPCVSTRVSGSEDIIQHGVNGLLVEAEDYQGMAQSLLMLLHDPELALNYGCAARTTVEQRYSLEHITEAYIELYQNIADREWQKIDHMEELSFSALEFRKEV